VESGGPGTVVLPPAVAALNIGVGPCWTGDGSVYKARPIMSRAGARAGATGDAGEAAGSKERSTEAQTNTRECPR
jgi:hypothetical protein